MSGDSLLAEVLARIEGERDRILVLAHVSVDISLRNLARHLGTHQDELSRSLPDFLDYLVLQFRGQ